MQLRTEVFYPNLHLQQCYQLHLSEHYQQRIARHAHTRRTPQVYKPLANGGLFRVARFDYQRPVEGVLQRILREVTPHCSHIETSTYDGPAGGTWQVVGGVGFAPRCVTGEGNLTFRQEPGGVRRIVEGDIRCSVWTGHMAERQISKKTIESLHEAAAYTPTYVRKYGVPAAPMGAASASFLSSLIGSQAPTATAQRAETTAPGPLDAVKKIWMNLYRRDPTI